MEKLSNKSIFSYGLGDMASQLVWSFVGTYLTVYYIDVVGLAPLAVSTIMMVAKIWDAINDPMMGAIAERTHSKWGRFRPYILFWSAVSCTVQCADFYSAVRQRYSRSCVGDIYVYRSRNALHIGQHSLWCDGGSYDNA